MTVTWYNERMQHEDAPWGVQASTLVDERPAVQHVHHHHHTPWFWATVGRALLIPAVIVGGFFAFVMVGAILLGALVSHLPGGDAPADRTTTTAVTPTTGG